MNPTVPRLDGGRAAFIAAGGALGATTRWGLGEVLPVTRLDGISWTLLVVNVLGTALLAAVVLTAWRRPTHRSAWIDGVGSGFCGGLTTFSGVAVVTASQLRDGAPGWAGLGAVLMLATTLGVVVTVRAVVGAEGEGGGTPARSEGGSG